MQRPHIRAREAKVQCCMTSRLALMQVPAAPTQHTSDSYSAWEVNCTCTETTVCAIRHGRTQSRTSPPASSVVLQAEPCRQQNIRLLECTRTQEVSLPSSQYIIRCTAFSTLSPREFLVYTGSGEYRRLRQLLEDMLNLHRSTWYAL
jgi:hypothetical protein